MGIREMKKIGLLVSFVGGMLFSNCKSIPVCGGDRALRTEPARLRGMWNSIRRIERRDILKEWLKRFLHYMLDGGRYTLKEEGSKFIVVSQEEDLETVCRVDISEQIRQMRDPEFPSRLYKIVSKYGLKAEIKEFLYRPPQVSEAYGETSVSGGNCANKKYRVDFSYWLLLSDRRSPDTWKESCQLAQKLLPWRECLSKKQLAVFSQRVKKLCPGLI